MGFRTWFYKKTGIKLKKKLNTTLTKFDNTSILDLDNYVNFGAVVHESSVIGQYTYLNSNSQINSYVNIGKFCSIASDVIIAPDNHPVDWLSTHPFQCDPLWTDSLGVKGKHFIVSKNHTTIMNDVWIGTRVIIKRGVKIGNGAIIGAGSVVTKDVPDYAIAAGIPAKIIRYRFSQDIIDKLLQINWWNLPIDQLRNVDFNDINKAIAQLSSEVNDFDS